MQTVLQKYSPGMWICASLLLWHTCWVSFLVEERSIFSFLFVCFLLSRLLLIISMQDCLLFWSVLRSWLDTFLSVCFTFMVLGFDFRPDPYCSCSLLVITQVQWMPATAMTLRRVLMLMASLLAGHLSSLTFLRSAVWPSSWTTTFFFLYTRAVPACHGFIWFWPWVTSHMSCHVVLSCLWLFIGL